MPPAYSEGMIFNEMNETLRKFLVSLLIATAFVTTAQVRWLEETHNFGAFDENDGKVSCVMRFVNESGKPVIINQVHVTCGCTSPSFDRNAIAPGDTGAVTITYNPSGRPGRFEKRIYVDMNTVPARYSLYIKGSVIGSPTTVNEKYPVKAGPLRLRTASAPFGEVTSGFSKSYFLEVYNASSDTVIPAWRNLPRYVSVGSASDTVFPGENMAYTFMLSSDKLNQYGLTTDSLTLVPDPVNHPGEETVIPMMVMVKEDFSKLTPGQMRNAPIVKLSESALNFGELSRNGKEAEMELTIKNNGNDPLIIRRVYTADKGVSVSAGCTKIKKGKSCSVTVKVNPGMINGNVINARVSIVTNDPAEPITAVRITGLVNN